MLSKNRRIPRGDFLSLTNKGKRYTSPHLLLSVIKNDPLKKLENSKFSFSVSKKVCKSAVGRNKLRRQGYSIVGNNLSFVNHGFFCSFSFKKGSSELGFEKLKNEILELLSEAFVIS